MANTWLITGANRGIGLELARHLANGGHTVFGTARRPAEASELKTLKVTVLPLDVSDQRSVEALPGLLKGAPLDALINNAGVSSEGKSITGVTRDDLRRVFDINAISPIMVSQALMPNLNAGKRKLVVNISTVLASITNHTGGSSYAYRASKAALNMLTVSMAKELAPTGFTCVSVHPGWVRTDMGGPNAPLSVEQSASFILTTLAGLTIADSGRFMDPQGVTIPW